MARPPKDSALPDARTRIIDAFWTLLETTPLKKITACMVAAEAHCNRGTFYYYFDGMDALVHDAISGLMDDGVLLKVAFFLDAGVRDELASQSAGRAEGTGPMECQLKRFVLIMGTGEMQTIDTVAKEVTLEAWRALLCPEGGELAPATCTIIKTMVGGTLTFLACECEGGATPCPPSAATQDFLSGRARNALSAISEAQGVPEAEIHARMERHLRDGAGAARTTAPRTEERPRSAAAPSLAAPRPACGEA